MTQEQMFSKAAWVGQKVPQKEYFGILRGSFSVKSAKKATLRVLGMGYFQCYINGKSVSEDLFLPLNSDYEARPNYPHADLSGHHLYVPEYDITSLLQDGKNVIALHFGGGWYAGYPGWWDPDEFGGTFGHPKAIWRIFGEDETGSFDFGSSEQDKLRQSYVVQNFVTQYEVQDLRQTNQDAFSFDFDDSHWENAALETPIVTEYAFSDCPADRVCEHLAVSCIHRGDDWCGYDCGKNITGYPVLRLRAKAGEEIRVSFSEERTKDGDIDRNYHHNQTFTVISDGKERIVRPFSMWYGFRYFTVCGNAEVIDVESIHTDVPITSSFHSDNETINWINQTFLNTQLSNMHAGIPSDCPHLERRGYTGDGQLICHAAMNVLDGKAFYRKWIRDILDCQDATTGNIQNTAPYICAGGGPGGWGCAVVEVPYRHYRHYGDLSVLTESYPAMLRYFDYMEQISKNGIPVGNPEEPSLFLGEWCPPQEVILPAPFIHNYFYIKALSRGMEIAKQIGKEEDLPMLRARLESRREATQNAYFNRYENSFFGGLQAADAFALDMGIGNEKTYEKLVKRYRACRCLDTGIFGMDVLTRVLFEHGDGQLAMELLLADTVHSFTEIKRRGGTTLWEYLPDSETGERSHNHPMFGAVTAYFYDYLLGIRQPSDSAGYRKLLVAPVLIREISSLTGHKTLPSGTVSLSYQKEAQTVHFTVDLPNDQPAVFQYGGQTVSLHAGKNQLSFPLDPLKNVSLPFNEKEARP